MSVWRELEYRFGPFVLNPERRLLNSSEGHAVHLTPKQFDLLLMLLQHAGHAVSRDDILRSLWPGLTVEESNITQNVFLLRKALGDTQTGDPYVETVPRHGYRVSVPVSKHRHLRPFPRQRVYAFLLLVLLFLLWGFFWYWVGEYR